MSEVPLELGYAATHEWAKQDEEGLIVVGISDHVYTYTSPRDKVISSMT